MEIPFLFFLLARQDSVHFNDPAPATPTQGDTSSETQHNADLLVAEPSNIRSRKSTGESNRSRQTRPIMRAATLLLQPPKPIGTPPALLQSLKTVLLSSCTSAK